MYALMPWRRTYAKKCTPRSRADHLIVMLQIAGKKKKLEAAEAEKQEEESIVDKAGAEAYDPTEATDDADIEEDVTVKTEDVEMEAGTWHTRSARNCKHNFPANPA